VAFSGTRTQHRQTCAIEDAGFEIRDMLAWLYGTGFPKSHDVAKGVDKMDAVGPRHKRALKFTAWMRTTGLTAKTINILTGSHMASHYRAAKEQPEVATADMFDLLRALLPEVPAEIEALVAARTVESENLARRAVIGQHEKEAQAARWRADYGQGVVRPAGEITTAYTPEAQAWEGWGTALKPAIEPICLGRKPLIGTVAANVLEYGTGALNIGACRVGERERRVLNHNASIGYGGSGPQGAVVDGGLGRWPANVITDGSGEVLAAFPKGQGRAPVSGQEPSVPGYSGGMGRVAHAGYADSGSASRVFYTAKADGVERLGSGHPTVKPVDLMRWLVRLVTPPGGVVLDPFAGTGTTGVAAICEGFDSILIERDPVFALDIERRLAWARGEGGHTASEIGRGKGAREHDTASDPLGLFNMGHE